MAVTVPLGFSPPQKLARFSDEGVRPQAGEPDGLVSQGQPRQSCSENFPLAERPKR